MSEKNNKTINGQKIFCLACMGLMAVASVVLVIMLFTSGLLNKGIVWAITGGLALLNGLHIWLQLGKGKVHVGKTVCGVIALLLPWWPWERCPVRSATSPRSGRRASTWACMSAQMTRPRS